MQTSNFHTVLPAVLTEVMMHERKHEQKAIKKFS